MIFFFSILLAIFLIHFIDIEESLRKFWNNPVSLTVGSVTDGSWKLFCWRTMCQQQQNCPVSRNNAGIVSRMLAIHVLYLNTWKKLTPYTSMDEKRWHYIPQYLYRDDTIYPNTCTEMTPYTPIHVQRFMTPYTSLHAQR